MKRSLICCAAVVLYAASSSFGAIVFFDDFNRTGALAGSTPNTGGSWSAISGAGTNPPQTNGSVVSLTTSGEDDLSTTSAYIPTTVGNPIHTGLDINVSAANATGDYFSHLGDASSSIFFQRLFAKSTTGGYLLGLLDTSGGTATYGTTVLTFGTPYHVDINWTPVAGSNNDTFAVFLDGSATAYLNHTWSSATLEPTLVKSASLRQGTAANSATLTVDNYQVDAATTIPVPEPATVMLLSVLGFAGLGCRRRG